MLFYATFASLVVLFLLFVEQKVANKTRHIFVNPSTSQSCNLSYFFVVAGKKVGLARNEQQPNFFATRLLLYSNYYDENPNNFSSNHDSSWKQHNILDCNHMHFFLVSWMHVMLVQHKQVLCIPPMERGGGRNLTTERTSSLPGDCLESGEENQSQLPLWLIC